MKIEFELDTKALDEANNEFFTACRRYKAQLQPIEKGYKFLTANPQDQYKFDKVYEKTNLERAKLEYQIRSKITEILY